MNRSTMRLWHRVAYTLLCSVSAAGFSIVSLCSQGELMLRGLNHITIAVSDIERSLKFYVETLGFKGHVKWDSGAYLSLGDLWFCLLLDTPDSKEDYTHLAFDVDESKYNEVCSLLLESGIRQWKTNSSEGDSLYILDPDGHKLEIHVGSLQSRLENLRSSPYKGLVWL